MDSVILSRHVIALPLFYLPTPAFNADCLIFSLEVVACLFFLLSLLHFFLDILNLQFTYKARPLDEWTPP